MHTKLGALLTCVALMIGFSACGSSSSSPTGTSGPSGGSTVNNAQGISLVGAGSTFDYPFFTKAFAVYGKSHSVSVNYQGVGSGAGIQQFTARTVEFGATDVPMSQVELKAAEKAGGPVIQIPIALGGVAIAYNLPGVSSGLRLTGPVIAQIYLGKITTWNDPAIVHLNPGMKLPSMKITPAHRSDASGTSYIFTDYLSQVSSTWKSTVGTGKAPNWPAGVGGKGNPGVAAVVQQTPGAIGYVELAYVIQAHMTDAKVQNAAGNFVTPTLTSVSDAAAHFSNVTPTHFSIVNAPGATSYPICGYSWVLLYRSHPSGANGRALRALMAWTATTGQRYAKGLDYAPLPNVEQQRATQLLSSIHS